MISGGSRYTPWDGERKSKIRKSRDCQLSMFSLTMGRSAAKGIYRNISNYRSMIFPVDTDFDKAQAFKALGDTTRLQIFEFLCACAGPVEVDEAGDAHHLCGSTVGEVCCHLESEAKTPSTVSFHLKELRNAGLISMERRGKNILCSVSPSAIETLGRYFERALTCKEGACA
jgi:ArsR family transcriptional regulator, arsenate/arsenite/antimonite-responsive transcriptional repressor